jgi:hypothetical protein
MEERRERRMISRDERNVETEGGGEMRRNE